MSEEFKPSDKVSDKYLNDSYLKLHQATAGVSSTAVEIVNNGMPVSEFHSSLVTLLVQQCSLLEAIYRELVTARNRQPSRSPECSDESGGEV